MVATNSSSLAETGTASDGIGPADTLRGAVHALLPNFAATVSTGTLSDQHRLVRS
jgi:hypothetical protein